jgi:diguanylate cyclase (GGDEF)-like protein
MRSGAAGYLVKGQLDAMLLERSIRYAVERARMLAALHELSIRDEMTGLYNRREMQRLLKEELERCRRYSRSMSLVMLDVDHFKSVNDTYGHQAGDEVLKWIARSVQSCVRGTDHVARYGGEELGLVLPETTGEGAFRVAERVRQLLSSEPCAYTPADGQPRLIRVTVSLGIASVPMDADNVDDLIDAADRALYEAKGRGRNCAVRSERYTRLQAAMD